MTSEKRKRRLLLEISYDGSGFYGWQIQKDKPTIQQEIKEAIKLVTGEDCVLVGASRTDSKVHAIQQFAHFDTTSGLSPDDFKRALNANLPKKIVIKSVKEVPSSFHAQYSALEKTYLYKIYNGTERTPFLIDYAWFFPRTLDVELMEEASKYFIGEHNFKYFAGGVGNKRNTVRTVKNISIEKNDCNIDIFICATGFLYRMARAIVGVLVMVGIHKIMPNDIEKTFVESKRKFPLFIAPPQGLYLYSINYK